MKVDIGKGTEAERQECVKECVNNRDILRWLLITLIRAERIGRKKIENLTMAYTNGIKVWMSISLYFYGYYGGPKESLWTPFSSLPLLSNLSSFGPIMEQAQSRTGTNLVQYSPDIEIGPINAF